MPDEPPVAGCVVLESYTCGEDLRMTVLRDIAQAFAERVRILHDDAHETEHRSAALKRCQSHAEIRALQLLRSVLQQVHDRSIAQRRWPWGQIAQVGPDTLQ